MVFPRAYRLTKKQDFQAVFAQPTKLTCRYLQALFCNNPYAHPRLGLAIAKHHAPRAVDRNRIRRVLRESFRLYASSLAGVDVVLLLRANGLQADNKQLRVDADQLWQRLLERFIP